MDSPVGAAGDGELPGAVEWIHDPHSAVLKPTAVVHRLLRQHHVFWAVLLEGIGDEVVASGIASGPDGERGQPLAAQLFSQIDQELARFRSQPSSQLMVVHGWGEMSSKCMTWSRRPGATAMKPSISGSGRLNTTSVPSVPNT